MQLRCTDAVVDATNNTASSLSASASAPTSSLPSSSDMVGVVGRPLAVSSGTDGRTAVVMSLAADDMPHAANNNTTTLSSTNNNNHITNNHHHHHNHHHNHNHHHLSRNQFDSNHGDGENAGSVDVRVGGVGGTRMLSPLTRSPSPLAKRARRLNDVSSPLASPCVLFHDDGDDHHDDDDDDGDAVTLLRRGGAAAGLGAEMGAGEDGRIWLASAVCAARRRVLAVLAARDAEHAVGSRDHLRGTRVTAGMREQVAGWCTELASDLRLPPATAAVAVNLFDRFVAARTVSTRVLHALAAAAFLVGAKTLADDVPPLSVVARRARVAVADMLAVEAVLLDVLRWRVSVVTPHEVVIQLLNYNGGSSCSLPYCRPVVVDGAPPSPAYAPPRRGPRRAGASARSSSAGKGDAQGCVRVRDGAAAVADGVSGGGGGGGGEGEEEMESGGGCDAMCDSLLAHALADYRLAAMRATSVGVACVLVVETARRGRPFDDVRAIRMAPLYQTARESGVDMRQVDVCVECLLAVVATLLDDVEDVDSERSE